MAEVVVMPKLGNIVETCLIVEWLKEEGDRIESGDILCTVETDKAAVDVESSVNGTLLKILYAEGAEVPVLIPIAVVGESGEDISTLLSSFSKNGSQEVDAEQELQVNRSGSRDEDIPVEPVADLQPEPIELPGSEAISPRARKLAEKSMIDGSSLSGTGPKGRVIERDVLEKISSLTPITSAAGEELLKQRGARPAEGTGIGGRITLKDVLSAPSGGGSVGSGAIEKTTKVSGKREIPVQGIRKIIADTMLKSVTTTAQFTLHGSADATNLMAFRKRLKTSAEELGLRSVTINDLVMYAVIKTLKKFSFMNAHLLNDRIVEYENINLGIAVDTKRGLLVPVVKNVENLTLKQFADRAGRVYEKIKTKEILSDELSGSTFTVTNLGNLGVEQFTPVLNIPEVAILGVCSIQPKAVYVDGEVEFRPHIGLSLTINHMAVDGAPAARFLQTLGNNIRDIDFIMAI